MSITKIKAADLVEDFDLYPRHDVDAYHVAQLAEALAAGEEMPPVIACKKTKRLADGFHRRRAYIRAFGEDTEIPVILKTYANDGALFLEAMQLNSGHGRKLTTVDVVRAATKAKAFGLDDMIVARALRMTVERVGDLVIDRTARATGGTQIQLKRTIRHMAGKRLTVPQIEANRKLSGMQPLFYVNQLITLIESDLLPADDEKLTAGLTKLATLLETTLAASA